MSELPANWKQILRRCNLFLARRELANSFAFANKQAEVEGKQCAFPTECVISWNRFAENPCYDTAVEFLERWQTLFGYFEGSCPDGQFYRRGIRTAKSFEIGCYKLGMHAHEVSGLRELTKEGYASFPRPFKDEAIYHAPPTQFVGELWDMMVGVIGGRFWKLSASIETNDHAGMVNLVREAYQHCEMFLGTPTEEQQGVQMWKMTDGNVILEVASVRGVYAVNLFVTDGDVVRSTGRTWDWKSKLGLH